MNKLLLGGAAAAAVFAMAPAFAQPAPPPPPGVAQGTAPMTAPAPPLPPIAPLPPQFNVQTFRMPMKTESRDDVVAHVREMFGQLDANKDGFVTREEVESAHQKMAGEFRDKFAKGLAMPGDFPKPDRGAMFDRLDTNKDGVISRDEFMAGKPDIREQHVFVMRNGEAPVELGAGHVPGTPEGPTRVTIMQDGRPAVEVGGAPGQPNVKFMRMHGMGMGMEMHGRMFETADANHDGKVSLQEMTAAALQHFDSADANHDGKLTPEERMQMHPRVKVEHMPPA